MEQVTTARETLDQVLEALRPERIGAPPDALAEFARRLVARAPADFLQRRGLDAIVEDVHSLFRFLEETPPREIAVRVRAAGERGKRALLETVMPDRAFIVNTLRECLHGHGLDIQHLLHPVLVVERDEEGRVLAVRDRSAEGLRTSVVQAAIEGFLDERGRRELEEELRSRLEMVLLATADYRAMVERGRAILEALDAEKREISWRAGEFEEVQDLLRWLEEDNFIYLGYREYRLEPDEEGREWISLVRGSGLGILRDEEGSRYWQPKPVDRLSPDLRARVLGGPLLIISKTNAESPVQRRERMDYIGVKRVDAEGAVRGEHRLVGLFTAKGLQQDASTIPILRRKLREILQAEGAAKGSHDYNLILQVFNSMPKEELFLSSVPELARAIATVMETEGADEVRLSARPDPLARGVNVMVILPRHRFSEDVREKIQEELVRAYEASVLNYHLALGESDQARLHFYLASDPSRVAAVDLPRLERRLRASVRSWEERLSDALERTHEADRAHELADRHREQFSAEYKATVDVETAVEDIARLESLEATGVQQVVLEGVGPDRPHASRLKIFAPRGRFVLSDVMPTLENLGFRVLEADKYDIAPGRGDRESTIHTFEVEVPPVWAVDREEAEPRVADCLRAVQGGWCDDDRLNSLVLSARLDWRQVAVLRAYAGYAFRIGAVASRAGVQRPLTEYPRATALLHATFEALLDPAGQEGRGARVARLVETFRDALRSVRGIEDDRTFRRLLNLVQSTVRTNVFQPRPADGPFTAALKFQCRTIEVLPRPRPRYEVYVSGPGTEAAHLRMDDVARGGLRWSDRSEDFRVEVLGLVKTQQVKNAVIVPAGAKGAFIVKRAAGDEEDANAPAVQSYREFVGTLLDLTDNVVGGRVVHPADTVVRDGEDPYLVVAADKGTARFSDLANELAAERGFWLGDAFASGGSRGYDHKALGITARGAWECVKRHFRELGLDPEREEFSAVGIGDMSGDVFGNGVLLSRKIRLLAAFDHRHIFVDPDPDPEASWTERKRMFGLARSSWADYDPSVLSEGGGVYERGAKEIPLSERAREVLGIDAKRELNGDALIQAILCAPVDLLWNGGIGTYVKAEDESQGDVGDPSSDSVRVDANRVRARVIAEGGNLGLTQRARVQVALRGGRLNTDALDNSAGVDMSDHEVNLKILLNGAMEADLVDGEGRNELLAGATEEVAVDVLADSWSQSLAVSLDEHRVREVPGEFRDALVILEREGGLDRALESLPGSEELVERQEEGRHLTRPELAVMLAYSKLHLKKSILASDLPDDPALIGLVQGYFPRVVRKRLGLEAGEGGGDGRGAARRARAAAEVFRGHRLRRHVAATVLTNRFVDRMGATAHLQLMRETGKAPAEVARMWYLAGRIGRAEGLYATLREAEAEVPAGVASQWVLEMSRVLERTTLWLLTHADPGFSTAEAEEWFGEPVAQLRAVLPSLLVEERRHELASYRSLYEADGLAPGAAGELLTFRYLDTLLPVAQLSRESGIGAPLAGQAYFGVSREIDFPWLQAQLARLPSADLWVQRAAKTLSLQLETARAAIAGRILVRLREEVGEETDEAGVERALEDFRGRAAEDLARIRQVVEDVRAAEPPELAALMVAVHAISSRAFGGGR